MDTIRTPGPYGSTILHLHEEELFCHYRDNGRNAALIHTITINTDTNRFSLQGDDIMTNELWTDPAEHTQDEIPALIPAALHDTLYEELRTDDNAADQTEALWHAQAAPEGTRLLAWEQEWGGAPVPAQQQQPPANVYSLAAHRAAKHH